MSLQLFTKDPAATLIYGLDWSRYLGSNTIETSNWTVPDGLTLVNQTNTTTQATVQISGGTLAKAYVITNTITFAGTESDPRSLTILIQKK